MVETVGKMTGVSRSLDGKNIILTFEVDGSAARQIESIRNLDKLRIRAVKYKEKRSLDANAYAWALMTKIADAVSSSKDEIYEEMLQKYGYCYEDDNGFIVGTFPVRVDVNKIDGHWKFFKGNGKFNSYLMIKGSSEYDTAEMAHFIDRIVDEAKELGIETATPEEIERMKATWGNSNQSS